MRNQRQRKLWEKLSFLGAIFSVFVSCGEKSQPNDDRVVAEDLLSQVASPQATPVTPAPVVTPTSGPSPVPEVCLISFAHVGYCADLSWNSFIGNGHQVATVRFWARGTGGGGIYSQPIFQGDELRVEMEPWMPAHGHGQIGSRVSVQSLSSGQYLITGVVGGMHGQWVIRIQLWRGTRLVDQADSAFFPL